RITHLAMLAEAHLKMRQPEEGLAVVEDLFVRMEKTRAHIGAAEGHQLKGELLLLGDPADMTRAEGNFATQSTSPESKMPSHSTPPRQRASRACSATPTAATRRERYSPKSTTGSPRASTPPT